ncbi:MAG: T9SS type A sorting domain-containing protein [Dinghuibacter sp.]|nr:T9SS type A sorting domain-containing protein [Dinghuibacter sp.]
MNNRLIHLPVLMAFCAIQVAAQPVTEHNWNPGFQKIISVNTTALPAKISQTRRKGFVISGTQFSNFSGNTDALLMMVNPQGKPEWTNGYDAETDYNAYESTELSDASVVAVTDQFDGRAGLLRTNKYGHLKWQKQWSITDGFVNFTRIKPLSGGQFLVAGPLTDASFNSGSLLVKFNSDGCIIWKKVYEIPGVRSTPVAMETMGSCIYTAGISTTNSFNTADTIVVTKINSYTGAVLSARKIWLADHAVINVQLAKRTDGNFVLSLTLSGNNTGETVNSMMVLNNALEPQQTIRLSNIPEGSLIGSAPTTDKGIAVIYNDVSFENGYLLKFNKQLQPVFGRYYPKEYRGSTAYQLNSLCATADGGFMMVGTRNIPDSTVMYLIKTDGYGKTGACGSSTISAGVEPFTLSSSAFTIPVIYEPELVASAQQIPQNAIPAIETELCPRENQCAATPETGTVMETVTEITSSLVVQAGPNPSTHSFTLRAQSSVTAPVMVRVRDIQGRLVQQFTMQPNQQAQAGNNWKPGVYLAELVQGNERKIIRLVKQ